MAAQNKVLVAYLKAYCKLVVSEVVRDKSVGESVALSIPLHFSGNHRVEITATEFSPGRYILSDMARTLGELSEGGKEVTADFRKRAEQIAERHGARFVMNHMLLDCDAAVLGEAIQRLAEASKTIGDAYLLQRSQAVHARAVVDEVKTIFRARQLKFKENVKLKGTVEKYPFDLLVPANGKPGLAVAVIAGHNTHAQAKIWAFNCMDVHDAHRGNGIKLGIVLDEEDSAPWTRGSKKILRKGADIVVSSSNLSELEHGMIMHGVA